MKNILSGLLKKLIPVDSIVELALKVGILRIPAEALVKTWGSTRGVRTQGCLALAAALVIGTLLGWIPYSGQAQDIITMLLGIALPTSIDKVERIIGLLGKVEKAVAEAEKADKTAE